MSNQKDNFRKDSEKKALSLNTKGFSDKVSNYYNVLDHDNCIVLAQRSQKIVTALYMVTDFLEINDPLRTLIRDKSTGSMDQLFSLVHLNKESRSEALSHVHSLLFATISYLSVIHANGFISEMNHSLIAQEIRSLRESIDRQITKSLPYDKRANNNQSVKDFSFSDSFFQVDSRGQERTVNENKKEPAVVKDTDTATQESLKDTTIKDIKETKILDTKKAHNVPEKDIKHLRETKITQPRTKTSAPKTNATKDLRHENILKILKQKRDASINDICALFKDCSSKTIQRDLSDLIEKNLVVKKGLRRWSTYNLAY